MERNSLSKMKDSVVDGINLADNIKQPKENSWDYGKSTYYGGNNLLGGFCWPPRSYTCSFCKREFRSAQALGGHMNVHRRDRARLRQSPPWVGQTSNPKPNPNPNFPPFTHTLPSILTPSPACFSSPSWASSHVKIPRMAGSPFDPSSLSDKDSTKAGKASKGFMKKDECKKGEMIVFDLEIGLGRDLNEDLDLELRLGYT